MSKSYRRPYCAIAGGPSAKKDKQLAARGVRAAHKKKLKQAIDWDEFLPPHRREASHNNVSSWSRDGKQRYQAHRPTIHSWEDYDKELQKHNEFIARITRK